MAVDTEYTIVNHGVRNNRGQIYLPDACLRDLVNLWVPTEADLVAETVAQKYPIGAQLRKNGKLYRYCKAGAAMAAGTRGFLKGGHIQVPGKAGNSVNSGFEGAVYAAVVAGATSFQIADTAAVKNEYEGAYFVVYDDTNNIYDDYRVIGNDVSDGSITTLYIAPPGFKHAIAVASAGITIYRNPYMGVRNFSDGGGYSSALGYAKFAITSAYFFWLQTAGFISGVTGASTWPGQTQYNREVYANTDGSLISAANSNTVDKYHRIGFLLGRTASDYGDNLIMLQLDQ